jgi:hypothetical protein
MSENGNVLSEFVAGVATTVAQAQNNLVNAVEKAEVDAQARRLIESLDNKRITDTARFYLIKKMDKLCERQELSDETKERVLKKMKEAEQRIDLSNLPLKEKEEFLARMKKVEREIEISVKAPGQSFDGASSLSRASSGSGVSSSSGSSSDRSTDTQVSGDSRASTAGVVSGLGKNPGGNGPIASPPEADKIGKEGEDKKAPTQSPGCGAGLKKAFSSCCSYFYNGLSSFTKLFSQTPKDRGYSQVPSGDPIKAQAPRQKREEPEKPNKSLFASIRERYNEFMNKKRVVDINKVTFDPEKGFGSRFHTTENLGSLNDARRAVKGRVVKAGNLAGRAGMGSLVAGKKLVGGMKEVGATGLRGANYLATEWQLSNQSWGEWANGLSASTRGMRGSSVSGSLQAAKVAGTFLAGAGVATVVAVPGAINAITPGPRAASFVAAVGGAGFGAAGSMVERMQTMEASALVPVRLR